MTGCEAMREAVQAYVDGALDPAARARLEAHLRGCAACRRAVAGYRRLFAALDEPAIPQAPPALVAAVMRRVATARERQRRAQAVVATAAMLLIGCVGALVAWGRLAGTDWLTVDDLSPLASAQALWQCVWGVAQWATAWGDQWLPAMPGSPLAIVACLALLAANVALAYRWRELARVNGTQRARTTR